jgi:hypothetical protein
LKSTLITCLNVQVKWKLYNLRKKNHNELMKMHEIFIYKFFLDCFWKTSLYIIFMHIFEYLFYILMHIYIYIHIVHTCNSLWIMLVLIHQGLNARTQTNLIHTLAVFLVYTKPLAVCNFIATQLKKNYFSNKIDENARNLYL